MLNELISLKIFRSFERKLHYFFFLNKFKILKMAEMLKQKSKLPEEHQNCKKIFQSFIGKFQKILSQDRDLKETSIAIRGYGAFAGVSINLDIKEIYDI
jgi:hypothetical protein